MGEHAPAAGSPTPQPSPVEGEGDKRSLTGQGEAVRGGNIQDNPSTPGAGYWGNSCQGWGSSRSFPAPCRRDRPVPLPLREGIEGWGNTPPPPVHPHPNPLPSREREIRGASPVKERRSGEGISRITPPRQGRDIGVIHVKGGDHQGVFPLPAEGIDQFPSPCGRGLRIARRRISLPSSPLPLREGIEGWGNMPPPPVHPHPNPLPSRRGLG